jgi:uncharacterized coiled-coil DUF342 family protein
MLDESEISKLLAELNSVKSEIRELRNNLITLDRKKEELFREKRKISSDIHSRIREAKDSKDKRNNLTEAVKNTKHSKEEIEAKIKALEEEIHKLKTEKQKLIEKSGVEDPMMLKRNIKSLEFKIETEGLTFEKEKEMMKVLGKMKKQYDGTKVITDIENKLGPLFRELRDMKSMIDMTKKIVQVSAKESQKHHIELIESSKEIDELKKKEDSFEENANKYKADIAVLSEEMNKKLERMDEIKKVLGENNVKLREDVEKSNYEILRQKDHDVQEKIKTGKKLTTEDLLVLQRTMKN